jgi:hypothetical protein
MEWKPIQRKEAPILRTRITLLAVAVLLLSSARPAQAQQSIKVFTSEDRSFSFVYPAGWSLDYRNTPTVVLSNPAPERMFDSPYGIMLNIYFPQPVATYDTSGLGETPAEVVKNYARLTNAWNSFFDPANSQAMVEKLNHEIEGMPAIEFSVNGRPAARFTLTFEVSNSEASVMFIVVDVADGYYVQAGAMAILGGAKTIEVYEPVILAILQSMQFAPPLPA